MMGKNARVRTISDGLRLTIILSWGVEHLRSERIEIEAMNRDRTGMPRETIAQCLEKRVRIDNGDEHYFLDVT
jgi:hypothetical protein